MDFTVASSAGKQKPEIHGGQEIGVGCMWIGWVKQHSSSVG